MAPALLLGILLVAPALPAEEPMDPAKMRAAQDAVAKAGLPLYKLLDQSNEGLRWTPRNVYDFGPAVQAASDAVRRLHEQYPSAVADQYGNGTLTNIEDTFKFFGGGKLERGCLSHQAVTFDALRPLRAKSSLTIKKIRYGLPPLQHNAVIAFPAGTDWKYTGIVFDGWLRQKWEPDKMTYLYEDWGPIRPVGGIEVEPRYWKSNVQLLPDDE